MTKFRFALRRTSLDTFAAQSQINQANYNARAPTKLACGAQTAVFKQQFWPLFLRSVIRKIISKCVKCFRVKLTLSEAVISSLPAGRVTIARSFTYTSRLINFAGGQATERAKSQGIRSYLCLFRYQSSTH